MQLNLENQVFAVTGAAQVIGAAIVASLSEAGATVAAIAIDADGLSRVGASATTHTADLGSREGARAVMDEVETRHGRIDGLVTAAGGVRGQAGRPIEEISEGDWHAILAANVDAAMWCAQAAAPGMKARGSGRIITISSGAGLRPTLTGIQAYASAKHALVGLTRQLALELGPHGVTGGLFLLTMHPHVIGYRSRMFILETLLDRIAAKGDCWVATHAAIARYCAQTAGLKGQP